MTLRTCMSAVAVVALFTSCADVQAAPRPAYVPITAGNAGRLRPIAELDRRVYKILQGPKTGQLVFFDWYDSVVVVDDKSFRPLRTIADKDRPVHFAISNDGRYVAWHERDSRVVAVQELDSGEAFEIEVGKSPGSAAFSPNNKLLAIGNTVVTAQDPEGGGYSELKIYDIRGRVLRTLPKSKQGALTPVFSPDGTVLAVGSRNYETRLFDSASGRLLHTLPRKMTQEIAFSPDGKTLATGYVDGTVALWNVANGAMLGSQPTGAKEVYSVDWNPRGDVLVTSGRDGKIVLWEPHKLAKLKELDAPVWTIQVRFTPDGGRLLSSGSSDLGGRADRKVIVWAISDVNKKP